MKTYIIYMNNKIYAITNKKKILIEFITIRKKLKLSYNMYNLDWCCKKDNTGSDRLYVGGRDFTIYNIKYVTYSYYGGKLISYSTRDECEYEDLFEFILSNQHEHMKITRAVDCLPNYLLKIAKYPNKIFNIGMSKSLDIVLYTKFSDIKFDTDNDIKYRFQDFSRICFADINVDEFSLLTTMIVSIELFERMFEDEDLYI